MKRNKEMEYILEATNIKKIYSVGKKKIEVLKSANLSVKKQEVIMICGPSGSGKTTLFNILSGIDTDYEGNVIFEKKSYSKMKEKERRNVRLQNFAYIFQAYCLMPTLSVYDNVILPLVAAKKEYKKEEVQEILNLLGIWDRKSHYPHELSGGEQQRVAIARAVVMNPKIIFADEPTGNLDYDNSMKVMEMLMDCAKYCSAAVLMVTHDKELVSFANRCICIKKGELISEK